MAVNKVMLNESTLIDLTADTATVEDVAEGKTFHLASGEQAVGTGSGGGGNISYPAMTIVDLSEEGANGQYGANFQISIPTMQISFTAVDAN